MHSSDRAAVFVPLWPPQAVHNGVAKGSGRIHQPPAAPVSAVDHSACQLNSTEVSRAQQLFYRWNGILTRPKLCQALQELGLPPLPNAEVEELLPAPLSVLGLDVFLNVLQDQKRRKLGILSESELLLVEAFVALGGEPDRTGSVPVERVLGLVSAPPSWFPAAADLRAAAEQACLTSGHPNQGLSFSEFSALLEPLLPQSVDSAGRRSHARTVWTTPPGRSLRRTPSAKGSKNPSPSPYRGSASRPSPHPLQDLSEEDREGPATGDPATTGLPWDASHLSPVTSPGPNFARRGAGPPPEWVQAAFHRARAGWHSTASQNRDSSSCPPPPPSSPTGPALPMPPSSRPRGALNRAIRAALHAAV
eukprot:RCo013014